VLVASVERGADIREVVAELAKAERQIQHGDVEREAEQGAELGEPDVDAPAHEGRNQHRDAPDDPRMNFAPRVEVAGRAADPRGQCVMNRVAARKRLDLLEQ
jgi:hypothetical protein